jgi:hypothetical protein
MFCKNHGFFIGTQGLNFYLSPSSVPSFFSFSLVTLSDGQQQFGSIFVYTVTFKYNYENGKKVEKK